MDVIGFILVMAISIALGICLSYYMTVKLMCSTKGRSMMRDVLTGYTNMTMEIATEAVKKATAEMDED